MADNTYHLSKLKETTQTDIMHKSSSVSRARSYELPKLETYYYNDIFEIIKTLDNNNIENNLKEHLINLRDKRVLQIIRNKISLYVVRNHGTTEEKDLFTQINNILVIYFEKFFKESPGDLSDYMYINRLYNFPEKKNEIITIHSNTSHSLIERIIDIHLKEFIYKNLSNIYDDFYSTYNELHFILKEIFIIRLNKILLLAYTDDINSDKLSNEEKEIFSRITKIVDNFKKKF